MSGKSPIDISSVRVPGDSGRQAAEMQRMQKERTALEQLRSGDRDLMEAGICTLGDIRDISVETILELVEIKGQLDAEGTFPEISQRLGRACKPE